MQKNKFLTVFIMIVALLALQVGAAFAAPLSTTLPDGTIVSVTQTTDVNSNVVFDVVVTDSNNVQQTVQLTAAEAVAAGLVTDNGDGTYTVNDVVGKSIVGGLIFDPCVVPEGSNPVASALTGFFCQGTAMGTDTIQALHDAGYGYGLIAQACFMAEKLGTTCGALLAAKSSKDFSTLGLEGVKNWGQLKKYVMSEEVHSLTNLGAIMSGRASPGGAPATTAHGHGKANGHGHGKP